MPLCDTVDAKLEQPGADLPVWFPGVVGVKHPDMSGSKETKPKKGPDDPVKPEAFDLWLKRGLHQIYDDIANEPIPDELRKLIEGEHKT